MKNRDLGVHGAEIVRNILLSKDPKDIKRLYKELREVEIQNNK